MTTKPIQQRRRQELVRLQQELAEARRLAFDGNNLASRPTPMQDSVLRDISSLVFWLVCANRSGKSQLGSRVVSWWFENNHPYMARPTEWGDGPLQILVIGRVGEQITSELYEKKIKPFLTPGTYKEVRIGNELKRLEHRKNGNRIIFFSHHDAANAREKVQAFTANVIWLDEMPDDAGLISELLMRILTTNGRLYATFTPLIRNEEIRRMVDMPRASARKVSLRILDNPLFKGREQEIETEVRANCASEDEFRARMYGDWYHGDTRVFAYYAQRHAGLPESYDPSWRHIAVLDPAASGYAGLVVGAENPDSGKWVIVKAKYLQGASAVELLATVEQELVGLNITAKWCDCNPAGFHKESSRQGKRWRPYTEKSDRKLELINQVNVWLGHDRITIAPAAYRLEDELTKCSWSDRSSNKIINSSSFHLLDCLRYLLDVVPQWTPGQAEPKTHTQALRREWHQTRAARAEARNLQILQRRGFWGPASRPGRWNVTIYRGD